jgi:Secretion system C-terminal sorting domain
LGYGINCRGSAVTEAFIFTELSELTDTLWQPRIYQMDLSGNLQSVIEYAHPEGVFNLSWADYIQKMGDGEIVFSTIFTRYLDSLAFGCLTSVAYDGTVIWQKMYGDSIHGHYFYQVKPTSDGGLIAIGSAELVEGFPKFYVVKTDSLGNEQWHKYLGYGNYYRHGLWVNELLDGSGYVVSGFEDDTAYDPVGLVFVLDTLGNITDWEKFDDWGNYDQQGASSILPCIEDGYVFSTQYNVEEIGSWEYTEIPQLVRIDDNLDTLWTCNLLTEPNYSSSAQVINETAAGEFVITGTLTDTTGTSAGHINKVSASGELLWHRVYRYAEFGDNLLFDIDPMPNGGFLCTGWMNGIPFLGDSIPDQDAWLLAVDSMGCLVPGCDTLDNAITEINPVEFSVYPNPADQFINIAFSKLASLNDAELKLFDMQGRLIKQTLLQHNQATYMFDCSTLENGTYLLGIESERFVTTKKIVITH